MSGPCADQALLHSVRGGRVNTNNEEPCAWLRQRVTFCKIRAPKNLEVKVEEVPEFPPPVPGQSGGAQMSARFNLPRLIISRM